MKDCSALLAERKGYKFSEANEELIARLLDMVYERLFDFMDRFYVNVSSYVSET